MVAASLASPVVPSSLYALVGSLLIQTPSCLDPVVVSPIDYLSGCSAKLTDTERSSVVQLCVCPSTSGWSYILFGLELGQIGRGSATHGLQRRVRGRSCLLHVGISGLCFHFPAPKVNKTAVSKTPQGRRLVEVGESPHTCIRSGDGDEEVHGSLVAIVEVRAASLAANVVAMALDHLRMERFVSSTTEVESTDRYASLALQTHALRRAYARTRRGKGGWEAHAGAVRSLFNWALGAESREWRSGSSLRGGRQEGSVFSSCSQGKNPAEAKTHKASGPVLRAIFCPQRDAVLFFLAEV